MSRYFPVIVASLCFLGACTSDSSLPTPSGKGTVRAINAIKGSPEIAYLVEESAGGAMAYKSGISERRWDDFNYNFNFEVSFPGEVTPRRIATIAQKIDANQDYTLVIGGTLTAPTTTVFQVDERIWAGDETVFEVRVAHLSSALGSADVYMLPEGTAPAVGMELGNVNFGEQLAPTDLSAGEYVVTFTAPGDPSTVLYQTIAVEYAAATTYTLPMFDGDELDVAPYNLRAFASSGNISALPDANTSPTVRIFQAAIDLGAADVYDDEMLSNLVVGNMQFGDITSDLSYPIGTTTFTFTDAGNAGATLFDSGISLIAGTHNNYIVIGESGSRVATTFVPDRRRIDTIAKLRVFHAAVAHNDVDLYVVEADSSIDEVNPTANLRFSLQSGNLLFAAGSYDIYLTVDGEKTVLDGPLRVDMALGDDIEAIVFDTTDPAIAEFRIIPAP